MTFPFRVGHGYDLHRLEPIQPAEPPAPATGPAAAAGPHARGRALVLGGVHLPHDRGPVSHSDGDALYHAVTDAILGALAEPDIGQLFPDTDPRHESQDSSVFLTAAVERAAARGWRVANLDVTVILERPKLSPHKDAMRRNLARLLKADLEAVNVKGKTHEQVDAVGEGRAVEVHAVVLLARA